MRRLYLTIPATWLVGEAVACASNNCLRALSNSRGGKNATADCVEFLQTTVTPLASTFTATVSVTSSVPTLTLHTTTQGTKPSFILERGDAIGATWHGDELEGRKVTASAKAIPSYASACGSSAALSSACSCIGVSPVTVTANADSTTLIQTVTHTVGLTTVRPSLGNHTVSWNSTSAHWHNSTSARMTSSTLAHNITSSSLSHTASSVVSSTSGPEIAKGATQETTMSTAFSTSAAHFRNSSSALLTSPGNGSTSHSAAIGTSPRNASTIPTTLITSSTKGSFLNSSALVSSPSRPSKVPSLASSTLLWSAYTTAQTLLNSTGTAVFFTSYTAIPTSLGTITAIHWVNATTLVSSLHYNRTSASATGSLAYDSAGRWRNSSIPSATARINTTTALWLNTSIPTAAPNITTGRWQNTTRLPANTTTLRGSSSTMRANATTAMWQNTSTKATPTPTPTVDLTCGETTAPFALQVTQPGGLFDNWYVHVVGDSLLFTSLASSASSFSVEKSGHLCAVGQLAADGKPYLASAGSLDNSSAIWMLDQNVLEHMSNDYGALNCTAGSTLNCAANATSNWVGCGLQLDLSRSTDANVMYDGFNCTSLGLNVVPLESGTVTSGNGTGSGLYRNSTALRTRESGRLQGGYSGGVTYMHSTT